MVDPNLTVMRRVTPLPFEMVVREYMSRSKTTTSLWRAYQRANRRFCGHEVPEDRLRCRQRNGSSITHIPPCCCCDESLYVLLNMFVLHYTANTAELMFLYHVYIRIVTTISLSSSRVYVTRVAAEERFYRQKGSQLLVKERDV